MLFFKFSSVSSLYSNETNSRGWIGLYVCLLSGSDESLWTIISDGTLRVLPLAFCPSFAVRFADFFWARLSQTAFLLGGILNFISYFFRWLRKQSSTRLGIWSPVYWTTALSTIWLRCIMVYENDGLFNNIWFWFLKRKSQLAVYLKWKLFFSKIKWERWAFFTIWKLNFILILKRESHVSFYYIHYCIFLK